MSRLRKKSSTELARLSCQLNHVPRGPLDSISPTNVLNHMSLPETHQAMAASPQSSSLYFDDSSHFPPRSMHRSGAEPREHASSYYEEHVRSSYYEDQLRYPSRSLHGTATRNGSPQYEEHTHPTLRSGMQLPIHPGPPNRNSCSSSSSNDFSDRRASMASGSTATTYSGPTDRPGRSNGNSPEARTLAPIRTSESRNRNCEQTRMFAQGPRYDSAERGLVDTLGPRMGNGLAPDSRRNSMLLQQPYYEPGPESCYEHVHEVVEYTRETRAILQPVSRQPVSRQPAGRQPVNKSSVNRPTADHQPENRQNVNFAKTDEKPKRRRGNLPKVVTDLLRQWFHEHIAHPYPTEEEKQRLMHETGLNMSQVCLSSHGRLQIMAANNGIQISNWFINARRRNLPQLNKQAAAESALREMQGDTDPKSQE